MFDQLFILAGLLLIAIPVMAIVAIIKASRVSRELVELRKQMKSKFEWLENILDETRERPNEPASTVVRTEKTFDEEISEPQASTDAGKEVSDEPVDEAETSKTDDREETPSTTDESLAGKPWIAAARNRREQRKASGLDLESLIGGRWSVLLGGLTLALGIVFLVKYSIEAGLLGPAMRTLLGAAFSALAIAGGEWLRRADRNFGLPVYDQADVPGILTGAGAIGAFATLYAAHALYGFIGPGFAFAGLTLIGIATMLASALHGPKLAAIGVLGAYATPILVSSSSPNHIALALHVLIVTATVLALAHVREWRWLAIAGFVASCIWVALAAMGSGSGDLAGVAGFMVAGLAVLFAALFFVRETPEPEDRPVERSAIFAFSLLTFVFLFQLAVNSALPATLTAVTTALVITAIACYRTSLSPVSICAAVLTLFAVLASDLTPEIIKGMTTTGDLKTGLVPPDTLSFAWNALLLAGPPAILSLWGARRFSASAPRASGWLASATSTLAFFTLVITYLRIAPFETRPLIGAVAISVAALLAIATEAFIRLKPSDLKAPAPAALAVGAIACACFALSVFLDSGWMPLAFALSALGIAAVYLKRPVSTLPWLALAAGGIAGFAIYINMPLELPNVSGPILFNSLILLLAVPAAALLGGGELLHRSPDTPPSLTEIGLTSGGLALAALFVGLETTHFINNGSLANVQNSLAETSGYALAAMGFAMGLQQLGERSHRSIFDIASQVAGIASVIIAGVGLLLIYNPAFDNAPVGAGALFNLLLPGFLLTGIAAAVITLLARPVRPRWYTLMYAALCGLLLFTYFSLMLRKSFQGQYLGLSRTTSDLEFWLYSPLWLVLGAILLSVGLYYKSLPIRFASGLLISLTVVKVFLADMSELTGILRAFSFIGLGISLIVIGRFYQRILTRRFAARKGIDKGDEDKEGK